MITDSHIMKMSLACAIVGIIGLILVVYTYEAPHLASLSGGSPGQIVTVGGTVDDVKTAGETTLRTVNGTKIVSFGNENIKKGDRIQVTGRIEIYEGEAEMIAGSIRKV